MKIFKYLFFLLLIVIIGGSIYVATIDGSYQVEEQKTMAVPAEMVFNEVNDYKNWEKWGPWKEMDPEMVVNYNEKTRGEGAGYSWQGNESMDGEMKTIEVIPPKKITQEIRFDTPIGVSKSTVYWEFEAKGDSTLVTWGMKGEQSFMEKAMQLTQDQSLEDAIKPMYKKGLDNIADVLKKKMEEYSINVDGVTDHSGGYYMYLTTASRFNSDALGAKMNQMLPQVQQFMKENNLQITGAPFSLYNTIDETNGTVIFSACIPTPEKVAPAGNTDVLCGYQERQRVVKATLKGDYKNLPEAWMTLENYIQQQSNIQRKEEAKPFEVYVTNPDKDPNPANWVTQIFIPIEEPTAASAGEETAENFDL